jgi:microcystin-dependent protein
MGLRSKAENDIPVGTVWPFYGSTAPPGWLLCDGGSTTGYAALAAQVGANVPDLRGRVPIGAGTGSGLTARTLGASVGSETATLSITHMPSHSHGGGSHGHGLDNHAHVSNSHNHGSANAHGHTVSHDHGPHAHGGNVMTGHGGWHGHGGDWGQVASSPQGFFTGTNAGTYNGYVGYNGLSTAGPNGWGNDQSETSGANSSGNTSGPITTPVIAGNGSGTAIGILPPTRGINFIIKT